NDGNTDGAFLNNSVSATDTELYAWWQIDLGAVSNIETIKLWNRTDNRSDRLSDYYVFVSDEPFSSDDPNVTAGAAGVFSFYSAAEAGSPTNITVNRTGRYVRVQLNYEEYLTIAEVEIMGCSTDTGCPSAGTPCDDGNANTVNDVEDGNCNCAGTVVEPGECAAVSNLAVGKAATQSSTIFGAGAERAVDGNTDGAFLANSVIATDFEANPWWQVDLGEVVNIETIDLWNRTDNRSDRFSDFYLFVSDVPFSSTDLNSTINQAGVESFYYATEAGTPTTAVVGRTGRYVRIQLNYTENLTIAEVEVYGCSIDTGCPAAGTPCDDADASTENDVEDGNCNCAGSPIGTGSISLSCPANITIEVAEGTTG
ncbi:MAG: discoidin domain-containing protein, partial [Bacteroidota bacterium]